MLIAEIKETADKLERDQASRGDLKILSRSLKELRYAFKVFTPLSTNPKRCRFLVPPRTSHDHPDYQASVEFGRAMATSG